MLNNSNKFQYAKVANIDEMLKHGYRQLDARRVGHQEVKEICSQDSSQLSEFFNRPKSSNDNNNLKKTGLAQDNLKVFEDKVPYALVLKLNFCKTQF